MAIRAPRDARNAGVTKGGREIDLTRDEPLAPDDVPVDLNQPVDIEELWKHRAELHKLCSRIVGDPITADDMVQETYLRALRHRDRLENRPSLMPWLATVARRRSLDEIRSRSRATPFEFVPDSAAGPDDDPERRVPGAEAVAKVKNAFSTLNDRERDLLTRQIEEGLSLSDLAEEENSSVDAVRSVLVRARAKLRHVVGDDAIFPVAAPVGGLGLWLRAMRDRANAFGLRVQRAFSVAPVERVGELVTAGVVTLAVSTAPGGAPSTDVSSQPARVASASGPASDGTPIDSIDISGETPSGRPAARAEPRRGADGLTSAIPGAAAAQLVLPPDDVETPEDSRFESFAVTGGADSVVLAAGRRRAGCVAGCTVLFRSDDAGATWSRLPARGITGSTIAAAPAYPVDPRIFAIGDGGLSVSRDGGNSFVPVLTVAAGPLAISPAFSAGDQRVFIGSGPALVWDDGTRSASPLLGSTVSDHSFFAFGPGYPAGSLYVGGAAPGGGDFRAAVYRCGRTVDEDACVQHTALPDLAGTPQVAALPIGAAGQAVFAWASTSLFRSLDSGASFRASPLSIDLHVNAMTADQSGTVYAAVHSVSGATPGGIARSNDGGASFRLLGVGTPLAAGATAVAVLPSGHVLGAPLAASGGGVMCSADDGMTWEARCV